MEPKGYKVQFRWKRGRILGNEIPVACLDAQSFPDVAQGETPIETYDKAQEYARELKAKLGRRISGVEVMPVYD